MTDQADPDGVLATLTAEHNEVERALADPAVHTDQARARTLGRRYAALSPIMAAAAEVERLRGDCIPRASLRGG
jgi:peptide chain release factor 1